MKALIDFDILRYEVGFGAETGWKNYGVPPWDYVEQLLLEKISNIVALSGANSYQGYLTGCRSFRYDIAKTKPYKGTRKQNKPWHFDNLTAYMTEVLNATVTTNGLEADDAMVIESLMVPGSCIIVSRDKDLRQVPGLFYSWELHNQASFGPVQITPEGSLSLDNGRLTGTGFAWFCAQCLMGDPVDNIPGLPKCGPIHTYETLEYHLEYPNDMIRAVMEAYNQHYGNDYEEHLLEQGQLCWLTRRLTEEGKPELWQLGQTH